MASIVVGFIATAASAQETTFESVAGFGSNGADIGVGVAADGDGNVYLTGGFRGTVDFDPGAGVAELTSTGGEDIFVAKFDSQGALVWAVNMGGAQTDRGVGIAVDGSGNVIVTGFFGQSADFDPGPGTVERTSASLENIFVVKLDADGALVWAAAMPGDSASEGDGVKVAVDAAGNIFVTGYFSSTVDFDPGIGTNFVTATGNTQFFFSPDVFVLKLNTSGELLWVRNFGGTQQDYGLALALDGSGNVYTTGSFDGTVDFDPSNESFELVGSENSSAFVLQLTTDGDFGWAAAVGGEEKTEGFAIGVDAERNVFVTGAFEGTADFDPGAGTAALTSNGMRDIFLLKLDANGDYVWAHRFGGTGMGDYGYGLAIDEPGNVYITGTFEETVDFDPGSSTTQLTSAGGDDAYVAKFDSAGNLLAAFAMGGTTTFDAGYAVAVSSTGGIYNTGTFGGTADFQSGQGATELTSNGATDIYLATHRNEMDMQEPGDPMDINGDDTVDAVDVQLVINAALGLSIEPGFDADVNGDQTVDAVDVQLVVNAALGVE